MLTAAGAKTLAAALDKTEGAARDAGKALLGVGTGDGNVFALRRDTLAVRDNETKLLDAENEASGRLADEAAGLVSDAERAMGDASKGVWPSASSPWSCSPPRFSSAG